MLKIIWNIATTLKRQNRNDEGKQNRKSMQNIALHDIGTVQKERKWRKLIVFIQEK